MAEIVYFVAGIVTGFLGSVFLLQRTTERAERALYEAEQTIIKARKAVDNLKRTNAEGKRG